MEATNHTDFSAIFSFLYDFVEMSCGIAFSLLDTNVMRHPLKNKTFFPHGIIKRYKIDCPVELTLSRALPSFTSDENFLVCIFFSCDDFFPPAFFLFLRLELRSGRILRGRNRRVRLVFIFISVLSAFMNRKDKTERKGPVYIIEGGEIYFLLCSKSNLAKDSLFSLFFSK